MALVTTSGSATADSYATLAEAEAYLAIRGYTSAWPTDDTTEEKWLKWAAIVMNSWDWIGTKSSSAQALAWPRDDAYDRDGYEIEDIPAWLKYAQAELAFQLSSSDWTQGLDSTSNDTVKLGSIELGREIHRQVPAPVAAICRNYLRSIPGTCISLVRG